MEMDKMTEKRFTVEKLELVSDHLSTRFFIKDHEEDKYYDVQHIVSDGFEVQYESWADKIAEKMNELHDKNCRFEFILQEAIRTERTDMGKNVLIQLADNLGVKYEGYSVD